MPSCPSCVAVARGAWCPMLCRPGASSITPSGHGVVTAPGSGSTLPCAVTSGVLAGRHRQPSAALSDSQSVTTTDRGGEHGCAGAQLVTGRQLPIRVDTLGWLIAVVVTAASVPDRDGAKQLWGSRRHWFTRRRCGWADGAYAGFLETWGTWRRRYRTVRWEISKRSDQLKGFGVLPKRGSVERTCGWFGKYRRLSKDYAYRTDTSEAMIYVVMRHIMVRRIAAQAPF